MTAAQLCDTKYRDRHLKAVTDAFEDVKLTRRTKPFYYIIAQERLVHPSSLLPLDVVMKLVAKLRAIVK
ncbi:hypothetical protein M378DRAFT_18027 [Amanita muscaria Koide BX008]|uniref:Uncharacterized protein n=1 Tax=Amanita muscaria (strain Koide BX008) TaxID=946122 RepID=A0A0C2SMZ9_AMAMK|nr:hypothetical protein M378DRAFT_18027 [Amanita muscaria Koide BX008]